MGKETTFQGVLEGWFAGNEEVINAYIHETSRKQINIPKVLDFNWLKSEKLEETRAVLKHQKLKKLLELTYILTWLRCFTLTSHWMERMLSLMRKGPR